MKRLSPLLYLLWAVALAVSGPACQVSEPDDSEKLSADAEAGEELYDQVCVLCHGPGAPPEADLTGVTERMDFAEFDRIMDEGTDGMPAWDSIDDEQRRNLWEYMATHETE